MRYEGPVRLPAEILLSGAAILLALVLVATVSHAASRVTVPEPDGLWSGPMRGHTPATLKGATVIDLAAFDAVVPEGPVVLDVGAADKKPVDFPSDMPWLPIHRSIPGAVWMPGAGVAPLDPTREGLFYRRLEELTHGDKARVIITFCHPECWGSWNAAKRLVLKGYTRVNWFPEGIEGWQDTHPTAVVKPDPAWLGTQSPDAQP
jgi:PQQ-dependent catabolism-associated CXXCW motif protein